MLKSAIKTSATPERVLELCKVVSNKNITENEVKKLMDPPELRTKDNNYFSAYRDAAMELGLLDKEDNVLKFIGDKKDIIDYDSFRRYCNRIVFKDTSNNFYRLMKAIVLSDISLIGDNYTSTSIKKEIQDKSGLENIDEKELQGLRFWYSFLGFGYVYESQDTFFLPNMYIALKDFCGFSKLIKNKTYSVGDFFAEINEWAHIVIEDIKEDRRISLALSNALRLMHDKGDLVLSRASDSKEIWYLFEDKSHSFVSEITHIKYKGGK